ncbi:hypothetical protein [Streptomyces laculatispora]|uniref:hypothetical protein n=1 Tax=Streptomyces laculatispora TaxID=887464 RepID=UPI0035136FAB
MMRSATLYDVLVRLAPEPMAEPGRAVAVAMVHGPRAGLTEADALADRPRAATGWKRSAPTG